MALDKGLESKKFQEINPRVCSVPAVIPASRSAIASSKVMCFSFLKKRSRKVTLLFY